MSATLEEDQEVSVNTNRQSEISDESSESLSKLNTIEIELTGVHRVGRFATFLDLTNAVLGAGVIIVPSTFVDGGLAPTTILIIIACLLNYISSVMMIHLQNEFQTKTNEELAESCLGKITKIILIILEMLMYFSISSSYLMIGAHQCSNWLSFAGFSFTKTGPWALLVLVYSLIPVGLSIFRKIIFLDKFQMATIICVIIYSIAVIYRSITDSDWPNETAIGYRFSLSVFSSFAIHVITFSLPVILMPVLTPYNPNLKKRMTVTGASLICTFILVVFPGITSYIILGTSTKSDILSSFSSKDIIIIVARVAIFLVACLSYPIIISAIIGLLGSIFFKEHNPAALSTKKRAILLPFANVISILLSMFANDLKPIFAIGGSVSCLIVFTFPSVCMIVSRKKPLYYPQNILYLIYSIFGIIAFIVCIFTSIKDYIEASKQLQTN